MASEAGCRAREHPKMIAMVRVAEREERDMKTIGLIGGMSWESTVVY